jgi:hypothetical protein
MRFVVHQDRGQIIHVVVKITRHCKGSVSSGIVAQAGVVSLSVCQAGCGHFYPNS